MIVVPTVPDSARPSSAQIALALPHAPDDAPEGGDHRCPLAGTWFPMMHVVSLVCRIVSSRSSTQVRSALGNRFGLGMTLAADAPTTDGRENPATDTSGSIPPRTGRRSSGATPNRSRYGLRKTVNHAEGHSTRGRRRGS